MCKGDISFWTKVFVVAFFSAVLGVFPFQVEAATGEGNATPTYTATPSGALAPASLTCKNLVVTSGQDETAPADVRFTTHASTTPRSYRYHFGDGVIETDEASTTHRFDTGGSYQAYVEVQDEQGVWVTSAACQTTVTLKNALAAGERWGCAELQVISGQDASASAQVTLRVAAVDNKTKISRYKLAFGDGAQDENMSGTFTHRYAQAGTYTARGWVQVQDGTWNSDETACSAQVRVSGGQMSTQPQTGVSVEFLLATLATGLVGGVLLTFQRIIAKR